jgi:putative oxidoreductase
MKGPEAFIAILHAMGVPAPAVMGWATITIELLGGFLLFIGAFVTMVSLPTAAILIVAAVTVHLPYGFSSVKLVAVTSTGAKFGPPGYEVDLLYLACLATLVLGGSGPFSVDKVLTRQRRKSEAVVKNAGAIAMRRSDAG